jgi:hypothetical protein
MGAVTSNWGDIPVVLRDKPWPALVRTGSQMAQYGTTLALVGGTFAVVDVSTLGCWNRCLCRCSRQAVQASSARCTVPVLPSRVGCLGKRCARALADCHEH